MEDQVTTMSRLDAEKGIELLKEMTPEQQDVHTSEGSSLFRRLLNAVSLMPSGDSDEVKCIE